MIISSKVYNRSAAKYTTDFAKFVKDKRNAEKFSQPELANIAGVGLRFLKDLE